MLLGVQKLLTSATLLRHCLLAQICQTFNGTHSLVEICDKKIIMRSYHNKSDGRQLVFNICHGDRFQYFSVFLSLITFNTNQNFFWIIREIFLNLDFNILYKVNYLKSMKPRDDFLRRLLNSRLNFETFSWWMKKFFRFFVEWRKVFFRFALSRIVFSSFMLFQSFSFSSRFPQFSDRSRACSWFLSKKNWSREFFRANVGSYNSIEVFNQLCE